MRDDLRRRAANLGEVVAIASRGILSERDSAGAVELVSSFENMERLQGCVLYDTDGLVLAATPRLRALMDDAAASRQAVGRALAEGASDAEIMEHAGELTAWHFVRPVPGKSDVPVGAVELVYDASWMFSVSADRWRDISVALIVMFIVITGVSIYTQRQMYVMPLRGITEWFRRFQKGETNALRPKKVPAELGRLAAEVEQMALSLRVARKAAADNAEERLRSEERWTQDRLRDVVQATLGETPLVVVSNREPFMHIQDQPAAKARCHRPASGVVTALDPVLRACGGTWIAHGSGNADRQFVNSRDKLGVPPDDIRYILKRVWLSKEEEEGYYFGFANEGLWPLCHVTHTRPIFRDTDWRMYRKVNRAFAESVIDELPANNPHIFIQDYHYTLLARMIRERRPDASIALFWHIPWPNPEVFSICPYQQEVLDGMLACDLIGFHVQYHCNNFIETANRLTECRVDAERFSIVRGNEETHVRAFPISVETGEGVTADESAAEELRREFDLQEAVVAMGVDRIDYTKGIVERILAVDRLLDKYPEYKGKFVLVQLAAPSRTHIPRYQQLTGEIEETVERVNWKHSEGRWHPVLLMKRHFSPEEIRPWYRLADLCIVSSLHDGMNLVAKEYVAAKAGERGVLVLSRFTGAARELEDAVLINPYSVEEFADSLRLAIELPDDEKIRRMKAMLRIVEENNIYSWAGKIMNEWASLRKNV